MATEHSHLWSNISFIRSVVLCATAQGADMNALCRAGGIGREVFEQANATLSLDQNIRIMEAALRATNNPMLGLQVGEHTTAAVFGLLGHLVNYAPTVIQALDYVCRYLETISNVYTYRLEQRAGECYFYQEPIAAWNELSGDTARMSVEISFAGFVRGLNRMQEKPIFPVRASMRYPRPPETHEYRRLLRVIPRFEQEANYLVFRQKEVEAPLTTHNPILHDLFLELVATQIAQTREKENFSSEVRRAILRFLGPHFPQLADIAASLHIAPRTLQRKLREEGTTFQVIADDVRSELAVNLLKNRRLTVNEVAYKLGYAEPSVFHRAFKKWTGNTPAGVRSLKG